MRKILLVFVAIASIGSATGVAAQGSFEEAQTAFRNVKTVEDLSITVPTVVQVPFTGEQLWSGTVIVYERQTERVIGSLSVASYENEIVPTQTKSVTKNIMGMLDRDFSTYAEYPLPEDLAGNARIEDVAQTPFSSSELTLILDKNVALPVTVEIRVRNDDGSEKIVLAKKRMTSQTVRFPKTTAKHWIFDFTYSQPLRISEFNLKQDDVEQTVTRGIRFLAQPNRSYVIYYNPDRGVRVPVSEKGDLKSSEGVIVLPQVIGDPNPFYLPADVDDDGIVDTLDNCVSLANPEQTDIDLNGRGDMCDDFDRDGRLNHVDNCPSEPNRRQLDEDGDGIGDACDEEESRFTERYTWVPWAGMGIAGGVLLLLFVLVARGTKREESQIVESESPEPPTGQQ